MYFNILGSCENQFYCSCFRTTSKNKPLGLFFSFAFHFSAHIPHISLSKQLIVDYLHAMFQCIIFEETLCQKSITTTGKFNSNNVGNKFHLPFLSLLAFLSLKEQLKEKTITSIKIIRRITTQ